MLTLTSNPHRRVPNMRNSKQSPANQGVHSSSSGKEKAPSPLLPPQDSRVRPPSERWVVDGRNLTSETLVSESDSFPNGTPVSYQFRTNSLSSVASAVGLAATGGAVLGATTAPLVSGIGSALSTIASFAGVAQGPNSLVASSLGQTISTGALGGAIGAALVAGGIAGSLYLSDLVSPYEVQGRLERNESSLAFKPDSSKHAIDLKRHAESPKVRFTYPGQWWADVAMHQTNVSAGCPSQLGF